MNSKKKDIAIAIVKKLRQNGFSAYFVGGCVRDMIMRKQAKDFDIATNAKLTQIKKIFPHHTYPVGAKFGTLLVVRNKIPFQVSTFRCKNGRYSQSLLEDVKSRDFTINGLAYDPIKSQIIDLVNGRSDIQKKKIRSIDKTLFGFAQDPLRSIRAIRFAVTLAFDIEHKTFQAINRVASSINKVSKERIRDELILIFTSASPAQGLALLKKTGLLKYVLPEVDQLKGVAQPRAFHPEGDVFNHTFLMLKQLKNPSLVLAFACLFHDVGKPATFQLAERIRFNGHDKVGAKLTERILKELKFSNRDREDIVACVKNHMRLMEAPKMRESTLKRLFARPTFEEELELNRIDCIASHKDLRLWHFLRENYTQFQRRPAIPKPILNGYELIKLGFTPGPIFGKIHKQMIDLQLEGKLQSKSQAERWLCKKFKNQISKVKINDA
jgi:poly(A) polymerase